MIEVLSHIRKSVEHPPSLSTCDNTYNDNSIYLMTLTLSYVQYSYLAFCFKKTLS